MSAETFIAEFIGHLARDDFYNAQTFTQYFSQTDHGGDEKNIVDLRVSQLLIKALGYTDSEYDYDNAVGKRRPDFLVHLSTYPKPCFIIEDKKSGILALEREALAQLEGYMRSNGAPRGLLCNGKRLLAYELRDPVPALIADLDLLELVARWRTEGNLYSNGLSGLAGLDDQDISALAAFYNRFSRQSYAGAGKLVHELTHTEAGVLHALDGSTFNPEFKSSNPDFLQRLIEQTRAVIQEIEFDVGAQLRLRLREFEEYQTALERLPSEPNSNARDLILQSMEALSSEYSKAGISDIWLATKYFLEGQLERFTERDLIDKLERQAKQALASATPIEAKKIKKAKPDQTQENVFDALIPEAQGSLLEIPVTKKAAPQQTISTEMRRQISRLQHLISSYHNHRDDLMRQYRDAIEVRESYSAWVAKVATIILKTNDPTRLQREFSAQTAYVLVVRMLLVRILEDKALIPRIFTNGGVAHWFETIEPYYLRHAQGKSTYFLLEMAYSGAQHIYRHFYSERLLYDWYTPDRNLVIRILHRFAQFDLAQIDQDVIGHLYSRYVEDKHKHESGMYYTPPVIVDYILDQVGYQGLDAVQGKRIIDPACGSGTFLVKAANRIVGAFKKHHKGKIPAQEVNLVLETVQQGVYGLDLNPFACYLAETNLLIQVLDPIKTALDAGQEIHLERFKIFNTDTLKPEANAAQIAQLEQINPTAEALDLRGMPEAEQIKLALQTSFDYVVANPPYVRADEGGEGLKEYRRQIKEEHPISALREACQKKWDLFVPFIALGWQLLAKNGTMGMITSNAIETVPYTESIRQLLTAKTQIKQLAFFPGVKLFEDAVVENTIFFVQNTPPSPKAKTLRRWFTQPAADAKSLESVLSKEETAKQSEIGIQVWRQSKAQEKLKGMHRLEEICFISAGMELQSHEIKFPNEFKKDDLVSLEKDNQHPAAYIEASDVQPFELISMRFLEYGSGLRAPERIRRARFPELFKNQKIGVSMVVSSNDANQANAVLDKGNQELGWLYTNHSIHHLVPWIALKGVENRPINDSVNKQDRGILEQRSVNFSLEFLQGILNSSYISDYLKANRRDRTNLYPDDYKPIPIPDISLEQQKPIIALVQKLNSLGLEFFGLRRLGWVIRTVQGTCHAPAHLPLGIQKVPLARAKMLWGMQILDSGATVSDARVRGQTLIRGRNDIVLEFAPETPERALLWLERQFKLCGSDTVASLEARGLELPSTPADAVAALDALETQEQVVVQKLEQFKALRLEIDALVAGLYKQ